MTTFNNILEQANKIVNYRSEEADRNYGPFNESMERTAKLASLMTNKEITTIDCFQVLNALKLSRQAYCHKEDNLLDLVAYVGGMNNYINQQPIKRKIDNNIKFKVIKDIMEKGDEICVRGQKTKELMNYSFTINPYDRFFSFEGRKMSLKYIKEELKWYLRADKYDLSICEHAKMWKSLINKDGSLNSNYGAILFNGNFMRCAETLVKDKFSRRAILMICNNETLNTESKDYHCTLSLSFSIRKDKLNCTGVMRSNDAIFGITNDIPFFTFVQELMYVYLRDTAYPELKMGEYTHFVNSIHIYEHHYKMANTILENAYEHPIECPKIKNKEEVLFLLNKEKDINNINEEYNFSKWLYN